MLTLRALQGTERHRWEVVRAGDLIGERVPAPVLHPQEPVLQALRKLAENGQSRLPVVDSGRLVGLLCGRDVMELMEIRAGLAPPAESRANWTSYQAGTPSPPPLKAPRPVPR
jgi:hypothetical protein